MRFFDAFMGVERLVQRRRTDSFFACLHGNKQTRGIHTFQVDLDTGEILPKHLFSTPVDPNYAFNYGRFVCVTYRNQQGVGAQGGINSYTASADLLALVSRASDQGKTYVHGCANGDDTTATYIFVADYHNGEVASIKIVKKKLVKIKDTFAQEGSSVDHKYQSGSHPVFVHAYEGTNKIVYLDLGLDEVVFLDYDEEGKFTKDETHSFKVKPGNGPKKMVFTKDGRHAYILNQVASTVELYEVDGYDFKLIQTVDSYNKEIGEAQNIATNIAINDKEDHLFVTNSGDDSIVLFDINEDCTLAYRDFCDTSKDPIDLIIYEDTLAVVACSDGSSIESYRVLEGKKVILQDLGHGYQVHEPVCLTKFIAKL